MPKEIIEIQQVKNNKDKQHTYQEIMKRYKNAVANEFYFEALLIIYAAIEDRMKSFLFYIGAIKNKDSVRLDVSKTKEVLQSIYNGMKLGNKPKKFIYNNISHKRTLIENTIR